jgi:hypothetical protein
MSLFVLDTDTLVLFQEGHGAVCRRVLSHPMEELAISVITVEEQLSGWYNYCGARRVTSNWPAPTSVWQILSDC